MPLATKERTNDATKQCKKRFFDAQWRNSITCYYDVLRRILPPSDRMNKRKRGRARVLKAAMQHLKYAESTIVGLLGGRALKDIGFLRNFFERFVEQHSCGVGAEIAKNALALLAKEASMPQTDSDKLIVLYKEKCLTLSHTKIKPLKDTKGSRVLSDVTSSTVNTNVAPSAYMQESNYNTGDNLLRSSAEVLDYPMLTDENYFVEEYASLSLEQEQVVPQNDNQWAPLISSLQCDHLHGDQHVPLSCSDASSLLFYITQEEVNPEMAGIAVIQDPLLGSAQLGPYSPEKPSSAFDEVCWPLVEWMLESDLEKAASSQEVPEL